MSQAIRAPDAPELAPGQADLARIRREEVELFTGMQAAGLIRPTAELVAVLLQRDIVGSCPLCPPTKPNPAAFPAVVCRACMPRGPAPYQETSTA